MERSETLGIVITHHYASERRENRLTRRLLSRPPDAFHGDDDIPGVALTLHPRLQVLGLRPRHSTFQVGYLHNRGTQYPPINTKHSTEKHNIVEIRA